MQIGRNSKFNLEKPPKLTITALEASYDINNIRKINYKKKVLHINPIISASAKSGPNSEGAKVKKFIINLNNTSHDTSSDNNHSVRSVKSDIKF